MLILGSFVFLGHEIPEKINFGGEQKLVTHLHPGGKRVVDAMGGADADITWDGRMRGPLAVFRARSLDTLRRSGREVELLWNSFSYRVVVSTFKADFERFYEIPYSITCHVVEDLAASATDALSSLLSGVQDAVGGALAGAQSAIGGFGAGLAMNAVDVMTARVSSAGSLTGTGSSTARRQVAQTANEQAAAMKTRQASIDATITGQPVGGITAGDEPSLMPDAVLAQRDAMGEAYATARVRAAAQVVQANATAPGAGS